MNIDPTNMATLPLPEFATYVTGRRPAFKQHSNMGQAKSALSVNTRLLTNPRTLMRDDQFLVDAWMYEFSNGSWHIKHKVSRGDFKSEHPLWFKPPKAVRVPKGAKPVSDLAVARAIASIEKAMQ